MKAKLILMVASLLLTGVAANAQDDTGNWDPAVVLAAIGERTTRLHLSTGVSLLANLDPFRVAEDYATLDVLTEGRAEIVAGRGSFFARTFEIFGQDPAQMPQLVQKSSLTFGSRS